MIAIFVLGTHHKRSKHEEITDFRRALDLTTNLLPMVIMINYAPVTEPAQGASVGLVERIQVQKVSDNSQ
jgi:hypothetical protein